MTNDEKKETARQFAYGGHLAHIAINKETWQRADFERDDISKIAMIPIAPEVETAVMFGLNYMERHIYKLKPHDKAMLRNLIEFLRDGRTLLQHDCDHMAGWLQDFADRIPEEK